MYESRHTCEYVISHTQKSQYGVAKECQVSATEALARYLSKNLTRAHAPAYTHSHTRTHTNTHAHTHTHTHTHTYSYTHTYTYTHKRGQARAVSPYLNCVSPRVYSQVVSLYDYVLKKSVSLCNTLQHTATHCNTLQSTWLIGARVLTLQHTATNCNTPG